MIFIYIYLALTIGCLLGVLVSFKVAKEFYYVESFEERKAKVLEYDFGEVIDE